MMPKVGCSLVILFCCDIAILQYSTVLFMIMFCYRCVELLTWVVQLLCTAFVVYRNCRVVV